MQCEYIQLVTLTSFRNIWTPKCHHRKEILVLVSTYAPLLALVPKSRSGITRPNNVRLRTLRFALGDLLYRVVQCLVEISLSNVKL